MKVPWSMLLLPLLAVNAIHEPETAHREKLQMISPDGEVAIQTTRDGHLTMEPGTVMRREGTESKHMELALSKNASALALIQSPVLEGGLKCNTPIFAPADACPFECPYLAEDSLYICHFRCLTSAACGSLDPLAKIADDEDKICRRCKIMGCADCIPGVNDVCRTCATGYRSDGKGGCYSAAAWVMFVLKIILVVLVVLVGLWLLELFTRKKTNWRGLKHGLAYRWRTRIHMPLDTQEEDGVDDTDNQDEQIHELLLYPLSTNLLRQPIAGPGLCLHMNYQAAILIWSACIIYMYSLASCLVSIDMLVLGLTPTKTSQQLCAVVHWGHDAQMRLIWAKCGFVIFAYLFTFAGCIYLGLRQSWDFHRLDDEATMKDFVAFCTGLPVVKGTENPEEELKKFIEEETNQPNAVRGVSICWNYTKQATLVDEALEADWKEREAVLAPPPNDESVNPTVRQPPLGFLRRTIRRLDCIFGFAKPPSAAEAAALAAAPAEGAAASEAAAAPLLGGAAEASGPSASDITTALNEMESSDVAFIVFDTETARDEAIDYIERKQGLDYKGSTIILKRKHCEPESARFSGLCYGTNKVHRAKKMMRGILITFVALFVWGAAFYLPYAYYMTSFSYAHGEEPSMFAQQFFNMLVVGGNQMMYFLADVISNTCDFMFEDDREVAYNYVYSTACVMNLLLDLLVTLWLAYKMMIGIGVHTADDRLLESLSSFHDVFESYPMQKVFGEMLYEYAFPSCFFYPFIVEGIMTILAPFYVFKMMVLSHDEVQERDAEQFMQYFLPMNLGRYADIILNMIIASIVFFTPGGFTLPMFIAYFFCHCGIYLFDHWRILRVTPRFYYASDSVDWFGQIQLIIPTAILASCCVFRFAQLAEYPWLDGAILYACCFLAFALHSMMHWLCLAYLVPIFKPADHPAAKETYADVAKSKAMTWFSTNPVHCLRSKYIFKQNPPSIYCAYGKEHLQKKNEKIGAFFEDSTYGGAYQLRKGQSAEEEEAKLQDKEEKEGEQAP